MPHQLDAFLRTTEGLPLQDDVYAWIVRSFSSYPRPSGASIIGAMPKKKSCNGQRDVGTATVDLCLTRTGFVEMYRCMWQAGGRDLEVRVGSNEHQNFQSVESDSILLNAIKTYTQCIYFFTSLH